MSTPVTTTSTGLTRTSTESLTLRALELHKSSKADNTHFAYLSDVNQYETFCSNHGLEPFPATPSNLALWIAELETIGRKYSTINRKVYAVSSVHRSRFDTVCVDANVKDLLKGLKREKAKAKEKTSKAKAMTGDIAGIMLRSTLNKPAHHTSESARLRDARNKALILLGYAGGFRVSELLGLDIQDVSFDGVGMEITLTHSKTSDKAVVIGVARWSEDESALCPVQCMRAWLNELKNAGIDSGRVFRRINAKGTIATTPNKSGDYMTRKSVGQLLKEIARRAGVDPSAIRTHSMRRGHITQAYRNGIAEQDICKD